jgi:uncharacterized protein YkwD
VRATRRNFFFALGAGWARWQQTEPRQAQNTPDRASDVEWHILFLTNQQRNRQKLRQFEPSPPLADVARAHSRDMLARDFFSHGNPEGLNPKDRVVKAGLRFRLVAENIYSTENGTTDAAEAASRIVTGWMKSPGHRRNILDPALEVLGVGVAVSETRILATQLFAR